MRSSLVRERISQTVKPGNGGGSAAPQAPPSVTPDYYIIAVVFILTAIGIIMVFSASGISSYTKMNDMAYFLKKDLMVATIAIVGMLFTAFFDYRYYCKISNLIYGFCIVLLVLVLIPHVGKEVNGARRWLRLGIMDFQVSEISKIAMIVYTAALLSKMKGKIKEFKNLMIVLGFAGVMGVLVLAEPDFGMCGLFMVVCMAMCFIAGARKTHIIGLGLAALPLLYRIVYFEEYRRRRFFAFLDPMKDAQGSGFQIVQSMIAIVSGGNFGAGLGEGAAKRFFLPEQHTDFIFSVLVEETGILGMVVLLSLFAYLGYRGMKIAMTCDDPFGSLLAFGITFMILTQAFINMGVASGLLPITGLTLPFISFGGASLLSTYLGIGILVNISMREAVKRKKKYEKYCAGGWGDGRTHIPGRGPGRIH